MPELNIKVGTDICSLARIRNAYERYGERFLNRILTPAEKNYVLSQAKQTIARLAGRFAAKEAAAKVLGTGWYGLGWKEVEILRQKSGEPLMHLHGRAASIAEKRGLNHFEVSISHEREFATAVVVGHGKQEQI